MMTIKFGKYLEIMEVYLVYLLLLYKYVLSFSPKIQVFTKETKNMEVVVGSCSKKKYSKNLGQILEKNFGIVIL